MSRGMLAKYACELCTHFYLWPWPNTQLWVSVIGFFEGFDFPCVEILRDSVPSAAVELWLSSGCIVAVQLFRGLSAGIGSEGRVGSVGRCGESVV